MSLQHRFDELVRQLRLLSEASSRSIVPFSPHGKLASRPPVGADADRRHDEWGGPYDPDRDPLLLWFLWRWAKARTDLERLAAVVEGELRLMRQKKAQPGRVAGAVNRGGHETEEDRDRRIAEAYTGLEPVEVQVIETELRGFCTQANVRKVRLRAGRDPETGEEREGLEDERRYAFELKAVGYSVQSIALRLGKPKSTVQSWLEKKNGKAA